MEIYGGRAPRALTFGHIVWPVLAGTIAGLLYLYLVTITSQRGAVDKSAPQNSLERKNVTANILAAFDALDQAEEIIEPADEDAHTRAPVPTSSIQKPKSTVKKIVKTADILPPRPLSAPPTITPAPTKPVETSSTVIPKTLLATATSAVAAATTTGNIQKLFEVKVPGGGGGGGGSSPPPPPPPTPPAPVVMAPDAPTGLLGVSGNAEIALSWTAPANDGGASISDYEIRESTDNFISSDTVVNDGNSITTSYTRTGLGNGTTYYFKVSAINTAGTGAATTVVSAIPIAPVTVPNAPTSVAATEGNAQIALSWTAPINTGGTGLTDYEIRSSTDNFASDNSLVNDGIGTSTAAYVVAGLVNGTTYHFKVFAVNSVGTSTASNVVSATPVAPAPVVAAPDAPTNIISDVGVGYIDLMWTAPINDGGSAITDYEVHYSTDNFVSDDQIFSHSAQTTTVITVDALLDDTDYYILIKAVNSVGAGSPSATVGPIHTPAGFVAG